MSRRFECIIVGAGPAGVTAALVLARAGVEVLVIERGQSPGSKNMFGGAFYGKGFSEVVPDVWEEAPIERPITRWALSFITPGTCCSLDLKSAYLHDRPPHVYTVLRSKFDSWYANKAVEAGVRMLTETLVEDVLWEQGRVVGIMAGRDQGELCADVVIAADGVNSLLAQKAGLRKDLTPLDALLGVKEILELPRETIDQVFCLPAGEGMAHTFIGAATPGVEGGGFIYTNRESLSVGFVARLSSLTEQQVRPEEVLEGFTHHPMIRPLLKDAVFREYAAHLIPESSPVTNRQLYTDGLLLVGDAAGLVLSTGLRHEGAHYAILSGIAAAETVKYAREKRDFSGARLKAYHGFLEKAGVIADFKQFRHAPRFFRNKRLYQAYPELVCAFAEALVRGEPHAKPGFWSVAKESAKGKVTWHEFLKDALDAWRTFG